MKKIMVHVVAALVVVFMFILTSLHAEQQRINTTQNKTTVPDVRGKKLSQAKRLLRMQGLQIEVMGEGRILSSEESELINRQEPEANKQVNRESKVKLWLQEQRIRIGSTRGSHQPNQRITLTGQDTIRHGTLLELQWNAVQRTKEYELHMSRDRHFTHFETHRVGEERKAFVLGTSENDSHRYFRVRAVFADGNYGFWSNVKDVTITAMVAPQLSANRASVNSDQLYMLNWSAVPGANYYYVERSTSSSFSRDQTFSYQVVPNSDQQHHEVTQRTTYFYRVQGRQSSNRGRWSNVIAVSVETGRSSASATLEPPRLAASATTVYGGETFQLSWNTVSQAAQYDFQSANNADFRQGGISTFDGTQTTSSVNIRNLEDEGVTYYYRVRARSETAPGAWSNIINVRVNPLPAPTLSANPRTAQSDQTYNLSWSRIERAREYVVEESTDSTFPQTNIRFYTVAATTTPLHNMVSQNTTYYYRVRGDNSASGGQFSNVISVAINASRSPASVLPAPSLSATPNRVLSNERFEVRWNSVSGARSYDVEEAEDSNFSRSNIFQTNLTQSSMRINLSVSRQSMTKYYRVRARDDNGGGPWSNTSSVFIEYREQ